jgi:hypothetical protein
MTELRDRAANSLRRWVLRVWESRGGGFYGFVAALTFVYLEIIDLAGDVVDLAGAQMGMGSIIGFVVGNLVDALVNGLRAAVWPLSWVGNFGAGLLSVALLLGSYAAYHAIRPSVLRLLTPTDDQPAPIVRPAAQ